MKRVSSKELQIIVSGISLIAKHRDQVGKLLEKLDLSMPNVKTKTFGGKLLWKNLVSKGGWKVQQNKVFGNCRILDPDDKRLAWGGKSKMVQAFRELINQQ